jgi:Domain of unknown function (DUF6249)
MRILLPTLVMALSLTNDARAADTVEAPTESATVQLGEGLVLSRPVYQQLVAREDGWAIIERMQQRAADTQRFEGMPHLVLIFASVLLLFWSAMFYYNRKHARLHRTIQLMVEKGQPPPVELLRAAEQLDSGSEASRVATAPPWASNLMWGGVLWITVGVTGSIYLWARGSEAWPWGLAAIAYGVAAAVTAYRKRDPR